MELIGYNESPIKIKRTIFNMDPRIIKTTKISRNVDSGQTQLQQIGTLIATLLRLEAIRARAYERWQPYFNEGQLNFLGLVSFLDVFHNDQQLIRRLTHFFNSRQKTLEQLRKNREDLKLRQKLQESKSKGLELMEELKEKIYALQMSAEEFQTYLVK